MAQEHPKTSELAYTFVDESWTTQTAKEQLRSIEGEVRAWGHLRGQKDLIDGMAAINILRGYL
jgi:RNase H-fold protein (predicted Holliday junction resolvase)